MTKASVDWPVALDVVIVWCLQHADGNLTLPAAMMSALSTSAVRLHTGRPLPQKHKSYGSSWQQPRLLAASSAVRRKHPVVCHTEHVTDVYLVFQTAANLSPLDSWWEGDLPCPSLLTLQLGLHPDPALLDI